MKIKDRLKIIRNNTSGSLDNIIGLLISKV